jgi:hypothetical protein
MVLVQLKNLTHLYYEMIPNVAFWIVKDHKPVIMV